MILSIDFNFYSGNVYSDGGWVPAALIAVGAVILTTIFQRFYDNYKNDERLDALFEYVQIEGERFGESAIKQAQGLIQVSKALKPERTIDFDIPKITAFNADQTKEWETSDFYFAIVSRRNAENLIDLIALHAKIKAAFNQGRELEKLIVQSIEDLNSRLFRVQDSWREHVQSIGTFYDIYSRDAALNPQPSDDFLYQYYKLITEWKKLPENTRLEISAVYKYMVLPLKELCKKHPLDNRSLPLLRGMQELTKSYNDLIHIQKKYRQWFLKTARQLIQMNVHLVTGFAEINKYSKRKKYHW